MAVKIALAIQKGGQAKTTTAVVMTEVLAWLGYSVLLVDLDSQGNATQMVSGKNIYAYEGNSVYEAIVSKDARPYIHTIKDNLELIAAEDKIALFTKYIYTNNLKNPSSALKRALQPVENRYDFIIMDCPPSLSDVVTNAIVYADYVMIPLDAGGFSVDALERFTSFVEDLQTMGHTKAEILGIVFTLRDMRSKQEKEIAKEIRNLYGGKVFNSEIRKLTKIKDSALDGINLSEKKVARVYSDYLDLIEETLKRINEEE